MSHNARKSSLSAAWASGSAVINATTAFSTGDACVFQNAFRASGPRSDLSRIFRIAAFA